MPRPIWAGAARPTPAAAFQTIFDGDVGNLPTPGQGWQQRADSVIPTNYQVATADPTGATIQGLFAVGSFGGATTAAGLYDPATDQWRRVSSSAPVDQPVGAAVIGGFVYIWGGRKASITNLTRYDPAAGTFTGLAQLPPGDIVGGAAAALGGRLYHFGGNVGGNETASCYVYDPGLDQWFAIADLPTARRLAVAAALDGKIYVIGGRNTAGNMLADTLEYDPAADQFTARADLPLPARSAAAAAHLGLIRMVGGATDDAGTLTNYTTRNLLYDPRSEQRIADADMPVTRTGGGAVSYQGFFYLVGGRIDGADTARVDRYLTAAHHYGEVGPFDRPSIVAVLENRGGARVEVDRGNGHDSQGIYAADAQAASANVRLRISGPNAGRLKVIG